MFFVNGFLQKGSLNERFETKDIDTDNAAKVNQKV